LKRVIPFILVLLLLAGIFLVPIRIVNAPVPLSEALLEDEKLEQEINPAWLPSDREVRVAIYNEPNLTLPEYATGLGMQFSNEISALVDLLEAAGFVVTTLGVQDILDEKLKTVDYDVFILADNFPRENITNLVKEYWLGGGGVLTFNAAFGFLTYAGILFPGEEGDDGYGLLWDEETWSSHEVVNRNPVTQDFQIDAILSEDSQDNKEFFNGPFIEENSVLAPYFEVLANQTDGMGLSSIVSLDNVMRGGRVVGMAVNTTTITVDIGDIIVDAVEWLCPQPKGYILYDLSHDPFFSTDPWDTDAFWPIYYQDMRNIWVNHTFCVDKLRPSAEGNLTLENLGSYDILVTALPEVNYSASEVAAVTTWITQGGSLFAIGDKSAGNPETATRTNYLLSNFNIRLNTTLHSSDTNSAIPSDHPTTERCPSLFFEWPKAYLNISSSAERIWYTGGDTWVGADEIQSGRIVVSGDSNIFQNDKLVQNNIQFIMNVANWLTSSSAEVLVYHDWSGISNYNPYRSAITQALNNLGMKFMLTTYPTYFNISLHKRPWSLVISDANSISPTLGHDKLLEHLEGGGKLIMRDFVFRTPGYPLWNYLGFEGMNDRITAAPPPVYLWDAAHEIFNKPLSYGASNISSTSNYLYTDYTNVTLFDNATAIAGLSLTPEENRSAIVLGAGGNAVCNMFGLLEYDQDTDDSTYRDNYEIWLNEIAYIMRPTIDSPSDRAIEVLSRSETIVWTPDSNRPYFYEIERNSVVVFDGPWDGGQIPLDLEEDNLGDVTFELTVYDTAGYSVSDAVVVTVEDTTYPAFSDAPDNLYYEEGKMEHLINWSFSEAFPDSFVFYINGTIEDSGDWDGSEISVDAGGLGEGVYNLTLLVNDTSDNRSTSTVYLTIGEASETTTTTTDTTTTTETDTETTPPQDEGDNTLIMVIAAVAGIIVVIVIAIWMKKRP
jgi:hypothetical protein